MGFQSLLDQRLSWVYTASPIQGADSALASHTALGMGNEEEGSCWGRAKQQPGLPQRAFDKAIRKCRFHLQSPSPWR